MNQVFQNLSNGELIIEDIPCPQIKDKMALIETNKSVISLGTERMLLKFGKAGYLNKAKQQMKEILESNNSSNEGKYKQEKMQGF